MGAGAGLFHLPFAARRQASDYISSTYFALTLIILDGKYHLLPSGELLIHNLEYNDKYATYRCRTMHKLTRQVVISNSVKIRMNGK